MDTVSFDISDADAKRVRKIVSRIAAMAGTSIDRLEMRMDLIATHANGCPLDFERMLAADDFNIAHDVYGIGRHIDRETGKLGGCFRPRFARRTALAA